MSISAAVNKGHSNVGLSLMPGQDSAVHTRRRRGSDMPNLPAAIEGHAPPDAHAARQRVHGEL